ncbi:MAG: nitronate monooxygenase [Pseudomonadota bacterium]
MWPDTRLTQLLQIEHPILQAPMAGTCTAELAAAVSNAGGLGAIGAGAMTVEQIEARLSQTRARTNRPLNLNFFMADPPPAPEVFARAAEAAAPTWKRLGLGPPPDAPPPRVARGFDEARMEILLAHRPAVASFHFGAPSAEEIEALQEAGILVLSSASTVAEARALAARGVDAIIAQGWEAGGHRGSHDVTGPDEGVGLFALIPQVVDAVDVPVIAAGGVADGRGVAAAFALGASGVQIGTGFLLTPEAATDEARRARLRASDGSDTMQTQAISGRSARAARSPWAEGMTGAPVAGFGDQYALSKPVMEAAPDEASFHLYGQAAALAPEAPAEEIVRALAERAEAVFARLALRL